MNPALVVRLVAICCTIAAGLASRWIPFESAIGNKYAGDSLYAVLIFLIIGLIWSRGSLTRRSLISLALVLVIECFQLTGIPMSLYRSSAAHWHLLGIALGTKFSWLDLAAYAVGIAIVGFLEYCWLCLWVGSGKAELQDPAEPP
ncbi:MAG: DUF2809 domain-containing protein [Leptospiraceae bacterium]|nr:DUF2809 domain-containing protein [Leptospiraceae bacterium]